MPCMHGIHAYNKLFACACCFQFIHRFARHAVYRSTSTSMSISSIVDKKKIVRNEGYRFQDTMLIGIVLLLIGTSNGGPLNDEPAREILPPPLPPPWKSPNSTKDNSDIVNEFGFQRGAVESPPRTIEFDRFQYQSNENVEFGSHRIPLRDAVEALPSSTVKLRKDSKNDGYSARLVP